DHVTRPQAGVVSRPACGHRLDEQPDGTSRRLRELLGDRLDLEPEARPGHIPAGDELVGDAFGEVDRDREAEADAAAAAVRAGGARGVLSPRGRAWRRPSAPPLFPGLIEASVWIAPTSCAFWPLADGTRT